MNRAQKRQQQKLENDLVKKRAIRKQLAAHGHSETIINQIVK